MGHVGGGADRSFRSFIVAIRRRPGFWLKLASIAAFGVVVGVRSGVAVALGILVVSVIVGAAIGYPIYRRTGRVP